MIHPGDNQDPSGWGDSDDSVVGHFVTHLRRLDFSAVFKDFFANACLESESVMPIAMAFLERYLG